MIFFSLMWLKNDNVISKTNTLMETDLHLVAQNTLTVTLKKDNFDSISIQFLVFAKNISFICIILQKYNSYKYDCSKTAFYRTNLYFVTHQHFNLLLFFLMN